MRGYMEFFDFKSARVAGWTLGASEVTAFLNGVRVGVAIPNGTRRDLDTAAPGAHLFSIEIDRPITALDVVSGRLEVKASDERSATFDLGLTANGTAVIREQAAAELGVDTKKTSWSAADLAGVEDHVQSGRMSPILVPAGLESPDKSAVIGTRGHLFLTDGSNALLSQYQAPFDASMAAKVDQWVGMLETRKREFDARGIRYVQTILPEKMTVLRDDSPFPIDGPTRLYQEVERRHQEADFYLSGLEPFASWSREDDPFQMTDTHMSASGAQKVFSGLARWIDPELAPIVDDIRMDSFRYGMGDLTRRFELPLYSRLSEPSDAQVAAYRPGIKMIERYFPTLGVTGRRFRWTNSSSPSPLKVLVFGLSSFNIGESASMLSWWGKHFFREFHFVWDSKIDWDVVESLQPDVVIGQSVERFLLRLPSS